MFDDTDIKPKFLYTMRLMDLHESISITQNSYMND